MMSLKLSKFRINKIKASVLVILIVASAFVSLSGFFHLAPASASGSPQPLGLTLVVTSANHPLVIGETLGLRADVVVPTHNESFRDWDFWTTHSKVVSDYNASAFTFVWQTEQSSLASSVDSWNLTSTGVNADFQFTKLTAEPLNVTVSVVYGSQGVIALSSIQVVPASQPKTLQVSIVTPLGNDPKLSVTQVLDCSANVTALNQFGNETFMVSLSDALFTYTITAHNTTVLSVNGLQSTFEAYQPVTLASSNGILSLAYASASEAEVWVHLQVTGNNPSSLLFNQTAEYTLVVTDPYTSPFMYFKTSTATASYIITTDGLGWYQAVNGTDGSISWSSTDLNMVVSSTLTATGTLTNGGTVYLNGLLFNSNLIIPSNVLVIQQYQGMLSYFKSDDWVMRQNDLARTGGSTSNPSSGALLWSYNVSTAALGIESGPIVVDGVLYVGTDYGVIALNSSSSAYIWSFHSPVGLGYNAYVQGSCTFADGVLYYGSYDYNVYALNATTGVKIWNYTTGNWIGASSPLVADGIVYVGSNDHSFYALNASTGDKIWSVAKSLRFQNSAAIYEGVVFVGCDDGNVYAFRAATGTQLWNYTTGNTVDSSPTVVDGVVYIGSYNSGGDADFYALNAATGTELWSYPLRLGVLGAACVSNGVVYFGAMDGYTYALNVGNGVLLWRATPSSHESSVIIAGGVVYVGSYDGNLYALNADTGATLWSHMLGGVQRP